MITINENIKKDIETIEKKYEKVFKNIDDICFHNQLKVLNAFQKNKIEQRHFSGSTGYGYSNIGRDKLNCLCADIFNCEAAIFSPHLSSGTQAITQAILGIVRPYDTIYSITGMPYDTLKKVLFGSDKDIGSLKDFNINFENTDLINGKFNKSEIEKSLIKKQYKIIYIQRSKGYEFRESINIADMQEIFTFIKSIQPKAHIVVDNCYGEMTEVLEPTDVGADLVIGSLIKNLGAGIAPTGGYIAGKKNLIELISYRLTSPSLGSEVGSYEMGYKSFFQGLFLAPRIVANALKGSYLAARLLERFDFLTLPAPDRILSDIVACIKFGNEEKLIKFCRSIQNSAAIDSHLHLEPCEMAGYENKIIMASGSFNQGSSIELSCDAPIKKPYIAFLQGGLTYEHFKIALNKAVSEII